jgi:hypothetical protein
MRSVLAILAGILVAVALAVAFKIAIEEGSSDSSQGSFNQDRSGTVISEVRYKGI